MNTTHEEISTRSEETRSELKLDSRRNRNAGCESGSDGDKQKRISGTDSPQSVFIGHGQSIIGGIIRQLIKDYNNQLAYKRNESKRIEEEKKRVDAEIVQIDSKIEEFKTLLEHLEANKKT